MLQPHQSETGNAIFLLKLVQRVRGPSACKFADVLGIGSYTLHAPAHEGTDLSDLDAKAQRVTPLVLYRLHGEHLLKWLTARSADKGCSYVGVLKESSVQTGAANLL